MQHRKLGSLSVSVVGLGCNNFGMKLDEAQTKAVVDAALDAGIAHFDTADIYGGTKSEEYLGRALGARRGDIVLATKFGMPVDDEHKGARPEYVKAACEASLQRLQTNHIDHYWLHEPDATVPIADTLGALNELMEEGKVRQIGCSNFSAEQLHEAETEAKRLGAHGFVAVQNEYSLLHRQPEADGVLAECQRQGLALVPYFPLASGLLSGKYRAGRTPPAGSRLATSTRAARFLNEENLAIVERLIAWVHEHNRMHGGGYISQSTNVGIPLQGGSPTDHSHTPAGAAGVPSSAVSLQGSAAELQHQPHSLLSLAISWLLVQPQVTSIIAGATTPEQVRANAVAGSWDLNADDEKAVRALLA
jgi:aryl-alcohol dehydrogenase-like predicted oxidoreductase